MSEPRFIVTFPLYVITTGTKQAPLTCVAEDDEEYRGVAMFTEELFAERTRDEQAPKGKIWEVTAEDLRALHIPLFKSWGYKYVVIDPHEHTGKAHYVPIEDLET